MLWRRRNARATAMPPRSWFRSTTRKAPRASSAKRRRLGSSSMQGAHHVAQRFRTSGEPSKAELLVSLPSASQSETCGSVSGSANHSKVRSCDGALAFGRDVLAAAGLLTATLPIALRKYRLLIVLTRPLPMRHPDKETSNPPWAGFAGTRPRLPHGSQHLDQFCAPAYPRSQS